MSRRFPTPVVTRAMRAWLIGLRAATAAGLALLTWALSIELAAPAAPRERALVRGPSRPSAPAMSEAVADDACEHHSPFGSDAAVDELARYLSRREWTAAAAVIAGFSDGEDRLTAWPLLLEAWAEADPAAALRFVQTRLVPAERGLAQAAVVRSWIERDLASATAWLADQPSCPGNDAMFADLAETPALIQAQPLLVLDETAKITDPRRRWEATRALIQRWALHDDGAARDYLARATAFTPEQRALLLRHVAQCTALLD
jgi:hypothetical protein